MSDRYGEVNETFPSELEGLLAAGAAEEAAEQEAAAAERRKRQEAEDATWRLVWDDVRAVIAATVPYELASYVDDGEPKFRRVYGPGGENLNAVTVSVHVPGCESFNFSIKRARVGGTGVWDKWVLIKTAGTPFEVHPVAGTPGYYATVARALHAAREGYRTRAKRESDNIPF